MRDRQVSIRRIAYELSIPKITIHEIMDNQLGMKKVCTWWEPKLFTPNRVDCCQESEANPDNFFDSTVTDDESWVHYYDPLGQLEEVR